MSFCVKCAQKDAEFEVMYQRMYQQVQDLKQQIEKLEIENEKLIIDLAFYGGNFINLSCNDK